MSNDKGKSGKTERRTSGLLGDLESIRTLLDESEDAASRPGGRAVAPRAPSRKEFGRSRDGGSDDDDVPLLEDVVHGGVSINETFLSGEGDFVEEGGEESGLNDELFKALLSDEWRESARELLDEARDVIEQYQGEWTAEHTEELNQALKARIDETLQQWLADLVRSRMDELRAELLQAVSEQIRITIEAQLDPSRPREDPDGE